MGGGGSAVVECLSQEQEFETYLFHVVSKSKTLYSLKVLVIPWNWWFRPDMTEKLLTGMLSINTNKHNAGHMTKMAAMSIYGKNKSFHEPLSQF